VRTYSDASCATVQGLSIAVGTCYYQSASDVIASWKIVCGSGIGASGSGTPNVSSGGSATAMTTGMPMPTMSDATASMTGTRSADGMMSTTMMVTESGTGSVTMTVNGEATMSGKTPPTETYHCSGNCTWTSHLAPSGSKTPTVQTGGPGLSTNGAEGVDVEGWKKVVLKALMAMGAAEAMFAFV
jgi:hypothetical protein